MLMSVSSHSLSDMRMFKTILYSSNQSVSQSIKTHSYSAVSCKRIRDETVRLFGLLLKVLGNLFVYNYHNVGMLAQKI